MNVYQHAFLRALDRAGGFSTRSQLGAVVSREEAAARRSCRARKWVSYGVSPVEGRGMVRGWHLTRLGRGALRTEPVEAEAPKG